MVPELLAYRALNIFLGCFLTRAAQKIWEVEDRFVLRLLVGTVVTLIDCGLLWNCIAPPSPPLFSFTFGDNDDLPYAEPWEGPGVEM